MKRLLRRAGWTLLGLVGTVLTLLLMVFAWPVFTFLAAIAFAGFVLLVFSHMIMPAP